MRTPRRHALLGTLLLLVVLAGLLPCAVPALRVVTAQHANDAPSGPIATLVPCLQPGAPRFATTCFGSAWTIARYRGAGDPTNGDAPESDPALIAFGDATPDGSADRAGDPTNGHVPLATLGEVGATYGVAFASGSNPTAPPVARDARLFVGAYTKRLTRFGPDGPGAIAVLNQTSGIVTPYVQVPAVVAGPRGRPGDPGDGSAASFPNGQPYTPELGGIHRTLRDDPSLTLVGVSGLGDIALDPQEHYLYAVNLHTRRVVRFDTWADDPQASRTLLPENVAALAPCAAFGGSDNYRPFSLLVTDDTLLLGGVCSATTTQTRADLRARVDRLALASGTWSTALDVPLAAYDAQRGTWFGIDLGWEPWNDDPAAIFAGNVMQPILSGLALTEDGVLLLGLRSRLGDQGASYRIPSESGRAFGDLLRAMPAPGGGWEAPQSSAQEDFQDDNPTTHAEQAWGALAFIPSTHAGSLGGDVLTTYLTPYDLNSAGAAWFDAQGGGPTAREELYATGQANTGPDPATFAKSDGLGDVTLLCAWRAVGDRVWLDTNSDGVQDSGEPHIDGVRLQVRDARGVLVATVTTGAITGASGNYRVYVEPFQPYTIQIDPAMFAAGQPLAGLTPTLRDRGADDARDSDVDDQGQVRVAAAGNGAVDLTFDIGLTRRTEVAIVKRGPTVTLPGATLSYTLTYTNRSSADAADVLVSDTLPLGLTFVNSTPPPTTIAGRDLRWQIGTLRAGASGSITLVAQVAPGGANGTGLTNAAQIVTTTPGDDPGDNTSSTTTLLLQPDLAITKTDGVSMVQPGDPLTYTLTITNVGPIGAAAVVITETPPLPIADPSWNDVGNGSYTQAIGPLAAGATVTRTLVLRLPDPLPPALHPQIINTAQVAARCCLDPTPGDTIATDRDTPLVGTVGDLVWRDTDGDGVQDADESGLPNVPMELLDPTSGQVRATTTSDAHGSYSFGGLRLGRVAVRIAPTALATTYRNYVLTTDPLPQATLTASAPRDDTLDLGLQPDGTTAVVLTYLLTERRGTGYRVRWGTVSEQATLRFRVERTRVLVRTDAVVVGSVPSQGSQGGDYTLDDAAAPPGGALAYWLVEVAAGGQETVYGPLIVRRVVALPLVAQ